MNVLPVDTICSIEYCGEFAFFVPIQNGIFLFICSIEYCGEFAFACRFKMGFFNLAIAPHMVQLDECV